MNLDLAELRRLVEAMPDVFVDTCRPSDRQGFEGYVAIRNAAPQLLAIAEAAQALAASWENPDPGEWVVKSDALRKALGASDGL